MLSPVSRLTQQQHLVFFRHPHYPIDEVLDPNKESFDQCLNELKEIAAKHSISKDTSIYEKTRNAIVYTDQWGKIREEFEREFHKAYEAVETCYHLSRKNILEIGTGMLHQGQSYLSKAFPYSTFTFSDTKEIVAKNRRHQKDYILLNLMKTTSKVNTQFECAVASNVFDTLSYDKLPTAFQRLSKHLKIGANFFHFAPLGLCQNAFFDICAREKANCTLLPTHYDFFINEKPTSTSHPSDYSSRTVARIDKDKVREILEKKKQELTQAELDFFTEWNNYDAQFQACAIAEILNKNLIPNLKQFEARCLEIFSEQDLEFLHSQTSFEQYMQKAAVKNGFIIENSSCVQADIETAQQQNQELLLKMGVKYTNNLPPNWFYANTLHQAVQFHIFIAKKISD